MSDAGAHPALSLAVPQPGRRLLVAGFGATLFASAFLLFSVQPIVSRLVLPRLGGTPAVWNTCVCFFQAALLVGYLYAHLLVTWLRPRQQVAVHAVLLLAALALMPLSMGGDAPAADGSPAVWLLALLLRDVGLPFVALAATAPLLQGWFARCPHPEASDPYFLYAASNAGSLLALLSYPVLVEPALGLSDQGALWSLGFSFIATAALACGFFATRMASNQFGIVRTSGGADVTVAERVRWVALAAVPSGLMLAVTTHITTDVASAPLFWVLPLAIYILTYVLAFARRRVLNRRWLLPAQGVALALAAAVGFRTQAISSTAVSWMLLVGLPLAAFGLTAAVCHAELARRRPEVRHLTGYFLLMSVGGALGGIFNVLIAPLVFKVPLEYPILLLAACLLRPAAAPLPTPARERWAARGDLLLPFALTVLIVGLLWLATPFAPAVSRPAAGLAVLAVPALAISLFAPRRVRLVLALAPCLLLPPLMDGSLATARSFFGVLRVKAAAGEDLRVLQHGTTVHGAESLRPGEELTPTIYYRTDGPFGRLFAVLHRRTQPIASVGVIGLGTGVLGCYAQPGERWTFREIDPLVEQFARNQRWFPFLSRCGNDPAVVLGDARITLGADANARYDLLVVDAFSSDSVPIHLITREALALYFRHLRPGGLVVFHVSNRYLDLVPVIARLAVAAGAPVRHLLVQQGPDPLRQTTAEAVAVGPPGGSLDALAADGWDVPAPGSVLWTDERSSLLSVVRWR